jgi:ornithine cyclodeaminase
MARPPFLYLGGEDVRRALPMSSAIEAMRSAFCDLASGAIDMPQRTRFDSPGGGITLVMPARSAPMARQALKLLTFHEGNPAVGLAVQDLYAASWAYENARHAGFGRELAR